MTEEQLYKSEETLPRSEIAQALATAAEAIEAGSVTLGSEPQRETVSIPEESTFEVELERATDSERCTERYELEYELHWTV